VATASTFSIPFVDTPAFYSGTAQTNVVPSVYPVAINGRPYLIDMKSGRYVRSHEQRVRDSQDTSTAPGEAAINPGGLWRRGQDSWHLGAGQQYADTAEAKDYMFYKSKGINPWVKGQISLHRATKLLLASAATTNHIVVQNNSVYLATDGSIRFSTNPFATSPTWTDCTGEPASSVQAMATDGTNIYVAFVSDGVRVIKTATAPSVVDGTKFVTGTDDYYMLGFAKNYMFGSHDNDLHTISAAGSKALVIEPDDTAFRFVGVATGQNAVYAAGYAGKKSLIYKITIKADGTLDKGVVALELPTGELVTAISGYLGSIILGTNKGVRYCTTDANSNLIAGPIIPTSGSVQKITSEGKYSWFTWSNYDGVSTGLGRLDLSTLTGVNTPAFATDLMYTSTANASNVVTYDDKRMFFVQGVGVVGEDTTTVVPSGEIEFGTYRWGIPDRKFVAKFDVRTEPLLGSVAAFISNDHSTYEALGTFSTQSGIEYTYQGTDTKTIEADFKLVLTRGTVDTDDSPTVTRWMARAYAAPFRSEVFSIPVLLHTKIRPRDRDIYMNPEQELDNLNSLIHNPRIVTLQLGTSSYSVITEDVEWQPIDSTGNTWSWDGTATVTMRSVEN
jgi:hypothetical protein